MAVKEDPLPTDTTNAAPSTEHSEPFPEDLPSPNEENGEPNSGSLLQPLELPSSDEHWSVLVVRVESLSRIVVRLVGEQYSDELDIVEANMQQLYTGPGATMSSDWLIEGDCCAVEHDGHWKRAILLARSSSALVFMGDLDCELYVELSRIRPLPTCFQQLPFQAFPVELYCLRDLAPFLSSLEARILGRWSRFRHKVLAAQVVSRCDDRPVLKLFDTTGEEDLRIHMELLCCVLDELNPPLPSSCVPTFLNTEGLLFVHSPLSSLLVQLVEDEMNQQLNEDLCRRNRRPQCYEIGSLYCVRYASDELFYRARLVQRSDNQAIVRFIDYGNCETVSIEDIHALSPNDARRIWQLLPAQAFCVRLHGWSPDDANDLVELYGDRMFPLQVVEPPTESGGPPVARLLLDSDLSAASDVRPVPGQTMGLLVTHAVHPGRFWAVVNISAFRNIMQGLQVGECVARPQLGGIYGAHVDGDWLRVRVTQLEPCRVVLVDLGGEEHVEPSELHALQGEQIPPLAIECALARVKTVGQTFNHDAVSAFEDMVYGKRLYAMVLHRSEEQLHVRLCDTSDPARDVWIDEELIRKGHAVADETAA